MSIANTPRTNAELERQSDDLIKYGETVEGSGRIPVVSARFAGELEVELNVMRKELSIACSTWAPMMLVCKKTGCMIEDDTPAGVATALKSYIENLQEKIQQKGDIKHEIRQCPHCQSTDLLPVIVPYSKVKRVECPVCGLSSSSFLDENDAVDSWNKAVLDYR